ncbi:MAG: hypothetical protein JRJ02_07450 [Deltaproteobacteria bacterium]|nr:hypothetical protein [Deltaproteobacteria bacterium]
MTPYLQIIGRLLQSFWEINRATDFISLFAPITLTEIISEEDHAHELLAPIPIQINLFSFNDVEGRTAELELNLKKDTRELVNARVQIFFTDIKERDTYFGAYIEPFFSQGFQLVDPPKYAGLSIREYRCHGLAIGLNFETNVLFISTYITLDGFQ